MMLHPKADSMQPSFPKSATHSHQYLVPFPESGWPKEHEVMDELHNEGHGRVRALSMMAWV